MTEPVKLVCATCGQKNRIPVDRIDQLPRCGSCGDVLVTGKVMELDDTTHDKATKGDDLPILVDYWAPWCGPCRMMAPEFAKAATVLAPSARLAKLNTEDHPSVSQRVGIRGIPALVLYHRGRELGRLAGARPAADIVSFVRMKMAGVPG